MSLITYLTRIHCADDILDEALQAETFRLKLVRILVVADGDALASGLFDRITRCLRPKAATQLFGCGAASRREAECPAAHNLYMAQGCDGLVAVGAMRPSKVASPASATACRR